jgi:thiol-disulfide isomerase/thioredoxin
MQKVRWPRVSTLVTLLVAVAAVVLSVHGDAADEPAKPETTPPAADAKPGEEPAKAAEDAPKKKDPWALPADDASPDELLLFMKRLGRLQPAVQTQPGVIAHFNKLDKVISQLLERNLDDATRVQASSFRFEVLSLLQEIGDETAPARRAEYIAALRKSDNTELADMGRRFGFLLQIEGLPNASPEDQQKVVDDIAAYLQEGEVTGRQVGLALQAGNILEQVNPELAIAAYNVFGKYVETAKEPQLAEIAKMMFGSARRLALPGNPIEVVGKTVDGMDFDIKQHKGKVVLVDFWATWCGPCMEEMPNVLENYEKYHDKGFEVVGISLDDSTENLNQFLETNKIPWVTLIDEDEMKRGFSNPIAEHYGVSGIPQVILVDQDGKVVSLEARGERLGELLAQLLGPVEDKPAEETPAPEEKPSAGAKPKVPTKQPLVPTKQPLGGK